jgi:hypothetical protein
MPGGLDLQWAGPVFAVVTFLTIWWGHILVRIVHYHLGTRPAPAIFLAGLLLLLGSTQTGNEILGGTCGIVGLTLLWDAFELFRQEARVRQGHAPLNPRVHRAAAGIAAARFAEEHPEADAGGTCLSCGSTPNSRFLCRRGPYCQVRHWERYTTPQTVEVETGEG